MRRRRKALPSDLEAAYRAADAAGDAHRAEEVARQLTLEQPQHPWAWFDLGLFAKRRRDWPEAVRVNEAALRLSKATQEDPAAWNLGIAATGLGDWDTARRAWQAYGITLPAGNGRIDADFGLTPVRLNPEPRHLGETHLVLDGQEWHTEVVWCQRLCPARARILNVPFPDSGHRRGDVVLHDGEPVGTRSLGGSERSVFNELAVLERSEVPTLELRVSCPDPSDAEALTALFDSRDLLAEDWTANVQILCKECSEGTPGDHDHGPPGAWTVERPIGASAHRAEAEELLELWAAVGAGRDVLSVDVAL